MDSPLYFFTIPQGHELFNVYNKHTICQHCVHSLPAEVWSVVAVFREDDVIGGIGEVGVAKVVFITHGDLTAKSFRLQSWNDKISFFMKCGKNCKKNRAAWYFLIQLPVETVIPFYHTLSQGNFFSKYPMFVFVYMCHVMQLTCFETSELFSF